jgi:hypothetical protein
MRLTPFDQQNRGLFSLAGPGREAAAFLRANAAATADALSGDVGPAVSEQPSAHDFRAFEPRLDSMKLGAPKCRLVKVNRSGLIVAAVFYGLLWYAFERGVDYGYMQALAVVVLSVAAGC